MITPIRSAALCDQVTQDPSGRANMLGLWGDQVLATMRPGYVDMWLALICDLDGRATRARLEVTSPDYTWNLPFEPPAGPKVAMQAYQLVVPILQPGALTLAIHDDASNGKPLRVRWELDFDANAVVLDAEAARAFAAEMRRFAEEREVTAGGRTKH